MRKTSFFLLLWVALVSPAMPEEESKGYTPPVYDVRMPSVVRVAPEGLKVPLPHSEAVSLEEAVALSLAAHENITEAEAAVAQAQARVKQSRSGAQPQVAATIGHTKPLYFNTSLPASLQGSGGALDFFTAASEGPSERVQLTQLLYDFNRTRSAVKASESRTRAAEFALENTRHQLIYETTRSYLDVLQSQSLAEVRLLTVENQALHVEEARQLHSTGLGLPIDVVRAQTAYANAVQEFTETRNQALRARVGLASFMGIDPRTPFEVKETGAPHELTRDLDGLVEQALAKRPGLHQSQALLEAQKFTLENAQAGNRPRLTTSLSFTASQVLPQPSSENLSLMLNLEIPLFDGGLTKAQAAEAEAGVVSAQAQLSRQERMVIQEVTEAYIEHQTAVQKIRNVTFEVAGAQESVRVATGRYKLGLGRFIEVLDSEQALATARTNEVNARTALRQAHALLKLAIGDAVLSKSL